MCDVVFVCVLILFTLPHFFCTATLFLTRAHAIVAQLVLISLASGGHPQTIHAQSHTCARSRSFSLPLAVCHSLAARLTAGIIRSAASGATERARRMRARPAKIVLKKKHTHTQKLVFRSRARACSVIRDSCRSAATLVFCFLHIVCTLRRAWNITTTQPTLKRGMKSRRNNINTQAFTHARTKCVYVIVDIIAAFQQLHSL